MRLIPILAILCVAAAAQEERRSSSSKSESAFREAVRMLDAEPERGVKEIFRLLERYGDDSEGAEAAIQALLSQSADALRKSELAESVSVDAGIEYLEQVARIYTPLPQGVKAEIRIAELEQGRGNIQAARQRLDKVLAYPQPFLKETLADAAALRDRIARVGGSALARSGAGVNTASLAPVPSAAKLKENEKLIRDLFQSEYARKSVEGVREFAQRLLTEARASADDPAACFVMLRESRDLFAKAGDAAGASEAVDQLARSYRIDPIKMMADALDQAKRAVRTPSDARSLAEAYLSLVNKAASVDDYDQARSIISKAGTVARTARAPELQAAVKELSKKITRLRKEYANVKKALAALEKDPANPEANLTAGLFHCLSKGDWAVGLPLLARGADPGLKSLAEKELASPDDPGLQAKVADGWFEISEKERDRERKVDLKARALHWYRIADQGATGLAKFRVTKRVKELEEELQGREGSLPFVDLLRWIDPSKDAVPSTGGTWTFRGGALVSPPGFLYGRIMIPCIPPEEYDLTLVATRQADQGQLSLGLVGGGKQFLAMFEYTSAVSATVSVFNSKWGTKLAADYPGEKIVYQPKLLRQGKPSTIICSVRRRHLRVSVDGKVVVDWKNPAYPGATIYGSFVVPDQRVLFISTGASFVINRVMLTPVSGRPKRSR